MSVPERPEGALLRHAAGAPFVPIERLAPGRGVAIVCPHPDDETLGCGQAIAAASVAGRNVRIVLLTDGEGSHPSSTAYDTQRLKQLRSAEFETALAHLAPDTSISVLRFGLRDGSASFRDISEEQTARVMAFLESSRLGAVWSTWSGDPHCDHECAALFAREIANRLHVPHWGFAVWGRFGERSVPPGLVRFDCANAAQRKAEAMRAYASQLTNLIADDPDGFVMPPALRHHFTEHPELFVREQ